MFSLAPVTDLVDALRAAGLRADINPAKVATPGVWVQVTGYTRETLATFRADLRLVLVVGDTDPERNSSNLLALLALVETVVPVHTAAPRNVLLPTNSAPLPGLEVPFAVRGDYTTP